MAVDLKKLLGEAFDIFSASKEAKTRQLIIFAGLTAVGVIIVWRLLK